MQWHPEVLHSEHGQKVVEVVEALPEVKVINVSDRTFLMHLGGKIEVRSKLQIRTRDDLSMVYTPGVARVCRAIHDDPERAFNLTIKRNTVAVVSDGSAVLGLGNIGPYAAMPVMEGKAQLFKEFGGVDAFPICLATQDSEAVIAAVAALAPGFGGINLEDIAAPRCFEIERRLQERLDIPVFHDDQHGTAVVVLAALRNAVLVVGKSLAEADLAFCYASNLGWDAGEALAHGRANRRATSISPVALRLVEGRQLVGMGADPDEMWGYLQTKDRNHTRKRFEREVTRAQKRRDCAY